MPHNKTSTTGGVALDRRKALTITAVGKLDSCRSGDPFKITKPRVSGEDECAEADVTKCGRLYHKIHWSQLSANGVSSQLIPVHYNGSQTSDHDEEDLNMLDMNRRQVKVLLTDVLQTEEGQTYLRNCGYDFKKRCQSEPKGEVRERRRDRRLSALVSERTRSNLHKNSSSSKGTELAPTGQNNTPSCKETKSPLPKRPRRSNTSETELSSSNEKEKCPLDKTVSSHIQYIAKVKAVKSKSLNAVENELCPVEERDSSNSSSSSLHSERTNLPVDEQNNVEQISGFMDSQRCSSSLSRQHHSMEESRSEIHSNQHNISKTETQGSAEVGENNQEKEVAADVQQNGELIEDGAGSRGSVLRLSLGAVVEQTERGLAAGEVTPNRHLNQNADLKLRKVLKLHTLEPIILSSEEEEEEMEDSSASHLQTLEGAKGPQTPQRPALAVERKKTPGPFTLTSKMHNQASSSVDCTLRSSPEMELPFSALYIGGLSVLSKGRMKISHDMITISLKDPTGTDVVASLATAHMHRYSVWDGDVVKDSGLVKKDETPPPSILLLWLSESQAQRLSIDLSVIQPGTCTAAEGSMCMLLCVSEALKGVEGALLASIMDIVGLGHETTELLSPLSHDESLKLLHSAGETHLLQLLNPRKDTQSPSNESKTAPVPASSTTNSVTDPEIQTNSVYTLCQSRAQGSYSVSMVAKTRKEWAPYKHHGPTRRLIQFPPPPFKRAITVTTEDLECLDSGEFLNDVIIDFYLKYLLVQRAPHSSVKRSHVFSSFFYKQLTRRDNANEDSSSTPAQLRRHQRVRTWTRHVDIFEKDFLFVPVNQEAHWYLVVVCFPGMDEPEWIEREGQDFIQDGTENSGDSMAVSETQDSSKHNNDANKSSDGNSSKCVSTPGPPNCTEMTCTRKTVCKRPCILIMDSLKLSVHERIFKLLREYLQVEWEVKRGGLRDFSAEKMLGSHCRVPLQDNSSDCGLYLLQYAESFLQDPVVHFDLPLRLECWFPRQQVREKREEIRDLVLHLYRLQQGSLENESLEDKIETRGLV